MFSAINFIKERRKLLSKKRQQDKRLFFYAVGGFVLVLLISVSLVGVDLFVKHKVKNQLKLQTQLNQVLKQSKSLELTYQESLIKLKSISRLFKERKNKQEAVNYFSNLFDPTVKISSISYDAQKKILSFSLYIPSVFKLEGVLDTLDSQEVKRKVSHLERGSISRSGDGSYSLSVKVSLDEANNFH